MGECFFAIFANRIHEMVESSLGTTGIIDMTFPSSFHGHLCQTYVTTTRFNMSVAVNRPGHPGLYSQGLTSSALRIDGPAAVAEKLSDLVQNDLEATPSSVCRSPGQSVELRLSNIGPLVLRQMLQE